MFCRCQDCPYLCRSSCPLAASRYYASVDVCAKGRRGWSAFDGWLASHLGEVKLVPFEHIVSVERWKLGNGGMIPNKYVAENSCAAVMAVLELHFGAGRFRAKSFS
ncbi:hypothetical protein BgiMline_034367 [Biomphalaria glabrata]|nr:hypothetical protein BgiMline_020531 [Biomphalaria glabrata]